MSTRRAVLAGASGAALAALIAPFAVAPAAAATGAHHDGRYVVAHPGPGRFPLVAGGRAAPIVVSAGDHPGVIRVVDDLRADIQRVTGVEPAVGHDEIPPAATWCSSARSARARSSTAWSPRGKLDVTGDRAASGRPPSSRWSSNPLPGVRRAFVIAGSDQRGTIYGAYDGLEADRRLALVLVGRRPGARTTTRCTCCPAGTARARRR